MVNEMQITSARVGFATNSSSSHSVIFGSAPYASLSKEEIAEKYVGVGHRQFGWDHESYTDLESIINYAIILFFNGLTGGYGESKITEGDVDAALENCGASNDAPLREILVKFTTTGGWAYIDHESMGHPFDYREVKDLSTADLFWKFIYEIAEVITDGDG